jgi:hypothetical protein
MNRFFLTLLGLTAACGGRATSSGESPDAAQDAAPPFPYAAECADAGVPPQSLECTGLYTDIVAKQIAPGVRAYAPAIPLWADFAEKQRWIWLPPGTKIDATNPKEWTFPVGTKVWKEFSRDGKRVETRLFEKLHAGFWVWTTYRWSADEKSASQATGGDIPWSSDGGLYHIPTHDECDQCHRGRNDRLLGFEQVSLGLSGATGLTLAKLVEEGLISPASASTSLKVGDDGTGAAAPAMSWLHINCGVTCHNENPNSTGYGAGMLLRLDPALLDGRPSTDFDTRTTTLDMTVNTPTWNGQIRIIPGDPGDSLLVKLITNRGTSNPVDNQMPPIATYIVDTVDTQKVISWIAKMPAAPADGGAGEASSDAGSD